MVQKLAFTLIAVGVLGIVFYLGWGFFGSPLIPLVFRILAGLAVVGFVLLLAYVGWDRYQSYKKESKEIKEVER